MATELASAVAVADDVRSRWCGTCLTSAGYEADVYAMVPSGLQLIGTLTGCDRCDPDSVVIVCHYCPTTVSGGVAFHRHLVGHSLTA